jgi:hypothetical protein
MLAKADLASAVRQMLAKEKKLFGTVGRQAGQIERVGQVDAAAAKDISGEASRALTIFDELKYMAGPVGDLLNEGTQRILAGESAAQVAKGIKNRLAASIAEAMGKEVAPAVDVVQEDMFAAAARAAEPIELTPDERLAAEAQLLQQAAANGKIRPPTAPIPDLPEPAQVRLDEVAAEARPEPPGPFLPAGRELYHGTTEEGRTGILASGFRASVAEKSGTVLGEGVYFTGNPGYAAAYGEKTVSGELPSDAKILDLYAQEKTVGSLAEEIGVTGPKEMYGGDVRLTYEQQQQVKDWALAAGYDGIRYKSFDTPGKPELETIVYNIDLANRLVGSKAASPSQPASKLAQATADEIRLAVEHKQSDAALSFEQQQALRDGTEYEALTFDEKKDLGLAADLDEAITPEVLPPESRTPIADALGATLRAMAESDARMFREIDQMTKSVRRTMDELAGPPARPVRPEPLRLTASAPQPEFRLPKELSWSNPRFGRAEVRFESDLDRTAFMLASDSAKGASAKAAKFHAALEEAGFKVSEVAAHGRKVKASIKEAARMGTPGEVIQLPAQPFGETIKPPTRAGTDRVRQQIEANNQSIDDIRRKAQQEGC